MEAENNTTKETEKEPLDFSPTEEEIDIQKKEKEEEKSENSKVIKVDEATMKEQKSKLPKVPKELFEKMVDNTGTSVAEYNRQGYKVLLFFMSYLGCHFCQGTLDDIVDLQEQLLLLNVIPIVVHNENQKTFDEWAQESERTQLISKQILHLQRTKEIKKYFKMRSVSVLSLLTVEAFATSANQNAGLEAKRLTGRGLKGLVKFVTKETAALLAGCYVVSNSEVISEFGKERKHQRFDLARIVIDTDGTGIEVHTDIYSCQIQKKKKKINPQEKIQQQIKKLDEEYELEKEVLKLKHEQEKDELKRKYEDLIEEKRKKIIELEEQPEQSLAIPIKQPKKSIFSFKSPRESQSNFIQEPLKKKKYTLEEILEDPKLRKFFKTFSTREYSVENVIFYEEVEKYKKLSEKKRRGRSCDIIKLFIESDSTYEINTTAKLKKKVLESLHEAKVDLFDVILKDLVQETMSNIYCRFILSELHRDMINSTMDKSNKPMYLIVK
eukprot:gene7434-11757_t